MHERRGPTPRLRDLQRPSRDIGAQLLALEVDDVARLVGLLAGFVERLAQRNHVQHTAAAGDELAIGVAGVPAWNTVTPSCLGILNARMTLPFSYLPG